MVLFFPTISFSASFDCSKANTLVEKTICADKELSSHDEVLNVLYAEVKVKSKNSKKIIENQRIWLNEINKFNTLHGNEYQLHQYILEAYETRISDLRELQKAKDTIFELEGKISIRNSGNYPIVKDNRMYFSNFDFGTKNKYNIVEAVPSDFKINILETTEGERNFIVYNETFLVYTRNSLADTKELTVKHRKQNKILAQKRFSEDFIWGTIVDGNKFLGVQKKEILLLDPTNLNVLKRYGFTMDSYVRNNRYSEYVLGVSKWNDKIVVQTYTELLIFDEKLNLLKTIQFGEYSSGKLIVSDNKAVVSFEKTIKVFDLNSNETLITVSKPEMFASFCLIDNFLLIAPNEAHASSLNAQVYDIKTGKIKTTFPLIASHLVYHQGYLLALKYNYLSNSTFTLYKIDLNKLATTNVINEQLKSAYDMALMLYKNNNNIYPSLEMLEKSGIEEYISRTEMLSDEHKKIVRQYAIWLSQTLDKYDRTPSLLKKIGMDITDQEVQKAFVLAKTKECFLESTCTYDKEYAKKIFGTSKISSQKIDFNISSVDKPYFMDNKIYTSHYEDGRMGVSIYDIDTLKHLKDIFFQPEEHGEYQDNVANIIDIKDQVVLDIRNRYDEKRDNFAVVDKHNFSLQCKGYTTVELEKLAYDNTSLCECINGKIPCKYKQSKTSKIEDEKIKFAEIKPQEKVIDSSASYIITSTGWNDYKLHFYPFNDKIDNKPKKSMRYTTLSVIEGTDKFVYSEIDINSKMNDKVKFSFYDIQTDTDETLFYMKTIPNVKYPFSTIYQNWLIIGSGHDLCIYDLDKMAFVAYHVNFIPTEPESNMDWNKIDGLYIYKDKLFVKTFDGKNSQVVDLKKLKTGR